MHHPIIVVTRLTGVIWLPAELQKRCANISTVSSFLLYVVSYERFVEYQTIIDNDSSRFFDIDRYNDFGDIITALEVAMKNQIRISYYSRHGKSFYEDGGAKRVKIYTDENAGIARNEYNTGKIKRTSFFHSLFEVF
jgi:hypothetical protein